jgi:glycosyltransferase involved in cell wall biosynthesis
LHHMAVHAPPDVTVIVATYDRPDALRLALGSVQWQTFPNWAVMVVGDVCDGRTQAVMDEFLSDRRFLYVNLTHRCREQALPNSAAMQVASTPFLALLNHDDIWLPDHLEIALTALHQQRGDLFVGRATAGSDLEDDGAGQVRRPVFERANPLHRRWQDVFGDVFDVFEPASAWVFSRQLAQRVGAWRPAVSLFRVPLQDWLLRAWRAGAKMVSDPRITCLKLETHWGAAAAGVKYESTVAGHEYVFEHLKGRLRGSASLRAPDGSVPGLALEQPFVRHHQMLRHEGKAARGMEWLLHRSWVAALYRWLGWDVYDWCCRWLDIPRGDLMRWSLTKRTGEVLRPPPPLATVIHELRAARQTSPNWVGWGNDAGRE